VERAVNGTHVFIANL